MMEMVEENLSMSVDIIDGMGPMLGVITGLYQEGDQVI